MDNEQASIDAERAASARHIEAVVCGNCEGDVPLCAGTDSYICPECAWWRSRTADEWTAPGAMEKIDPPLISPSIRKTRSDAGRPRKRMTPEERMVEEHATTPSQAYLHRHDAWHERGTEALRRAIEFRDWIDEHRDEIPRQAEACLRGIMAGL